MTPPIRVWRNVLIFVLAVCAYLLVFFFSSNSPFNQTVGYYQEQIKTFHRTGKDTVTVVVLGSSLALNAFGAGFPGTNPESPKHCKPIKILRLTVNGLTMETVHAFDILKTLAAFPPNYLLFESNLFVRFAEEQSPTRLSWNYNLIFVKINPKSLIRRNASFMKTAIENQLYNLFPSHFTNEKNNVQTEVRRQTNYSAIKYNEALTSAYFQKLEEKKCKIIFVKFPVIETPHYKKILPELDKTIDAYQTNCHIDSWEMTDVQLSENQFSDGAHLNQSGSRVFIPWFSGRLNQELCNN